MKRLLKVLLSALFCFGLGISMVSNAFAVAYTNNEETIVRSLINSYGSSGAINDEVSCLLDLLEKENSRLSATWEGIINYWDYALNDIEYENGINRYNPNIEDYEEDVQEVLKAGEFVNDYTGSKDLSSVPTDLVDDDSSLCIVILGNALKSDGSLSNEGYGRVLTGYELSKVYENALIAVTGGGTAENNKEVTEGGQMKEFLLTLGVDENKIIVEDEAMDTSGNALNTLKILEESYPQIDKILMVTSDYHISRGSTFFNSTAALYEYDTGKQYEIVGNCGYATNNDKEAVEKYTSQMYKIAGIDERVTFIYDLFAQVTDAGQHIYKMTINFGDDYKVDDVKNDTFTVHASSSTADIRQGTGDEANDYDKDRTIVKTETEGQYVTLYFDAGEDQGATLSYISSGRNYPADLTYTVTQEQPVTLCLSDGTRLDSHYYGDYVWTNQYDDEETAKFKSVIVDGGINYQFYEASNSDTLIVWFHGNGEGDYNSSNNNVAQVYANRGTVAWASDEAQSIFGGAYVMSFQAPDTWYYNYSDKLLEKAYNEIMDVVNQYGIENLVVSGCSAGGYMTTSMLIEYPDLFDVAMINCPALDVAKNKGGVYLSDEQLESITDSDTAIWLVQGMTDGTVATPDCSVRLFNALTGNTLTYEGEAITGYSDDLTVTRVTQDNASDYTTYQTYDNKYLISLYDTTAEGYLVIGEDYNFDEIIETVEYPNHWSWIYTLRNNPTNAEGTHIWNWAASMLNTTIVTVEPETSLDTEPDVQPTSDIIDTEAEDEIAGSQVKTGDNTNITGYILLVLIAGLGLTYAYYSYRKKEN